MEPGESGRAAGPITARGLFKRSLVWLASLFVGLATSYLASLVLDDRARRQALELQSQIIEALPANQERVTALGLIFALPALLLNEVFKFIFHRDIPLLEEAIALSILIFTLLFVFFLIGLVFGLSYMFILGHNGYPEDGRGRIKLPLLVRVGLFAVVTWIAFALFDGAVDLLTVFLVCTAALTEKLTNLGPLLAVFGGGAGVLLFVALSVGQKVINDAADRSLDRYL